jgi:hypothetical protein
MSIRRCCAPKRVTSSSSVWGSHSDRSISFQDTRSVRSGEGGSVRIGADRRTSSCT